MTRPGRSRKGVNRAAIEEREREQLFAAITRIMIAVAQALIDRFLGGGGPGHPSARRR